VADGGAAVIAVVTFAGQDEDAIVFGSERESAFGDDAPDFFDDVALRFPRTPGSAFPGTHFFDRDDRRRHCEKCLKKFRVMEGLFPHARGMITMVVGTNRPGSRARAVSRHVEEIYRELKVELRVVDLADLPAEIFNPSSYEEAPASFRPFQEAISNAHGLVIVTPEYNGSVPGILKYFVDMLEFPESFERRPVCFVGVAKGMWGALRPVEQLQAIFGYRNGFIYPERVFMPGVDKLLDDGGRLKDASLIERLRKQAVGYVDFVERIKGVKLRPAA